MKKSITLFLIVILLFLTACNGGSDISEESVEVTLSQIDFGDKNYYDVWNMLEEDGFTNVQVEALDDLLSSEEEKNDLVERVTIDGSEIYEVGNRYVSDVEVKIYYHNIKMVYAPFSSEERPEGKLYEGIEKQFKEAGFINVQCEPIEDLVFGWLTEDGEVESITIAGSETFDDLDIFAFDTEIVIKYHTFSQKKSEEQQNSESNKTEIEQPNEEKELAKENELEEDVILTVDNCHELSEMLSNKAEIDDAYIEFAEEYEGYTIEFDGRVDAIAYHETYTTRYDILVSAGDFDPNTQIGPAFQFRDVNYYDLGLETLYLEDEIWVGKNVHIVAKVVAFDSNSGLFYLDPVSVAGR